MAPMVNVVVGVASVPLPSLPITNSRASPFSHNSKSKTQRLHLNFSQTTSSFSSPPLRIEGSSCFVLACLPPSSESSSSSPNARPSSAAPSTRLYVSGLSFRTTEESLRNVFKNFGQLVDVNLVMDKLANRPRGFAFLRYATEEESQKAIEGMHGKWTPTVCIIKGCDLGKFSSFPQDFKIHGLWPSTYFPPDPDRCTPDHYNQFNDSDFLDGRVIFVEVAKPRSELQQRFQQNTVQKRSY